MLRYNVFMLFLMSLTTASTNCFFGIRLSKLSEPLPLPQTVRPEATVTKEPRAYYNYVNLPYIQGLKKHTVQNPLFWLSLALLNTKGSIPLIIRVATGLLTGIKILEKYAATKELTPHSAHFETSKGERDAYIFSTVIAALHALSLSLQSEADMPFLKWAW